MFIVLIVGFLLCTYLLSPFIAFFHELGHAIAYLVLTRPNYVDIYIGTNQTDDFKFSFKVWKLGVFIKPKLNFKYGGFCKCDKQDTKYINNIIILLSGSLSPLFLALTAGLIIILNTELHGAIKLFFACVILISFLSLLENLIPRNGSKNDGTQLQFIFRIRKVYSEYQLAMDLFKKGNYINSLEHFLKLDAIFPNQQNFQRNLISLLSYLKRFDEAQKYLLLLNEHDYLSKEEYLQLGFIYSIKEKHDLAIENYREVLSIDNEDLAALNNLAFEFVIAGDFAEAEKLLEKALMIDPEFSAAYGTWGFLKIERGDIEKGKQLLDKSLELEIDNAYTYRHLGAYYLRLLDKNNAILNLKKALELDAFINISDLLREAEILQ